MSLVLLSLAALASMAAYLHMQWEGVRLFGYVGTLLFTALAVKAILTGP